MSYRFIKVKRYKRQPVWPDGQTITCTRCRYENQRSRQVTVVAVMKYSKTTRALPVAYCDEHTPDQLVKT